MKREEFAEAYAFFVAAKDFCDFIDRHQVFVNLDGFKSLFERLSALYRAGYSLALVDVDFDFSTCKAITKPVLEIKQYDAYWEVFDPYHLDEPLIGELSDDLSDIYIELKKGLQIYQKDKAEALWYWKFGFDSHWGFHAIDALRALHYVIFRELDSDDE
ncbi:MAG: DUF5063 domain-containing protein [Sporolactobacillus sp.]